MKCSRFDPETIAYLPKQLRASIRTHELREEEIIKNVIAQTENMDPCDIRITTNHDSLPKEYKNLQMHNYSKHEQTFIRNTTKEEASKNAEELINMEKMAKAKVERKEAKKKRQKDRKKAEKTGGSEKNEDSDTASLKDATTTVSQTDKTENDEDCEDDKSSVYNELDEQIDINAAFVQPLVKRNKNISTNTNSSSKTRNVSSSVTSGSMPKFVKPNVATDKMNHEAAEIIGNQSYQLILNSNDFDRAVHQLNQAVSLAPNDIRHFLNRSYCYLRLGQYTSALNDARFARKCAQSMEDTAKAVAREGQALFGLHKYHEAEECFKETIELGQRNKWILGELILVRTLQLTSMGFSKTSALKALQQCSTVADAVTLLTSGNIDSSELENNVNESEVDDNDGNEIYFSDDESSNTFLLSNLVSALADETCYFEKFQSEPFSSKVQQYANYSESTIKNNFPMESMTRKNGVINNGNAQWQVSGSLKSVSTTSKPQIKKIINSNSSTIWVGNIENGITDNKLRTKFSQFGTINYIRRFPEKRFVFIDFTSKKAAIAALNNVTDIEINGIKLPIKPYSGSTIKK